ncbi:MAG: hypothetical protein H6575_12960 [Lewinellaceae bacterium]|nr:hypothetical protein [Lewinellaceae bacterium]
MNTLRTLLLIALAGLFFNTGYAQGWERVYHGFNSGNPNDGWAVVSILPLPDGTFMLLLDSSHDPDPDTIKLATIDENGILLSEKALLFNEEATPMDLTATSDGGYALITTRKLIKLDAQLAPQFEQDLQMLDPGKSFWCQRVVESNAGLCVVGRKTNPTAGQGFIACYDLNGNLLQFNDWGLPVAMNVGSACVTPDGGVLAVGQGYDGATFNAQGIVATRFNADGSNVVWEKIIYDQGISRTASSVVPAPGGGYLIAGSRVSRAYALKIDEQGDMLWERDYWDQPGLEEALYNIRSLSPLPGGTGYWSVFSYADNQSGAQPLLAKMDLSGDIQFHWRKNENLDFSAETGLQALADGGCVFGGSISEFVTSLTRGTPFLARFDSLGNTFLTGIAGTAKGDLDGDCIAEVDSLLEGIVILAVSNGQYAGSANIGSQGTYFIPLDTGNYQVTILSPGGPLWSFCPDTLSAAVLAQDTTFDIDFTGFYNVQPIDSIYGYVFEDYDGDCIKDDFEPGYPNWQVSVALFHMGTFVFEATTDSNGYFIIPSPAGITNEFHGFISLAPPPNDGLDCAVTCQQSYDVMFGDSATFQALFGVHCDSLAPYPLVETSIATNALRPCTHSFVHASYCNNGAVTAENAELIITVDPALEVVNSNVPWSEVNGNEYRYELGDLLPEACGDIVLTVNTSCSDPVGTTYCFEAHGLPDTIPQNISQNWDGSQVVVSADCVSDSVVFTIHNAGLSDMSQILEYIVIEDNVLLMQAPGQFQLAADDEINIRFSATGAFYRLEAQQSAGFPGLSKPVAWVEGCNSGNGTPSLGFVNLYPLPDNEPWLDIFCLESVNSYDPNDKNGFPRGYSAARFIEENTDIEYLIRFQNTGTAPALEVEIRDTIPVQWLDPLTVRPGASSHPYEWDMQGSGVVVFRFPGINLPDSSANPDQSQGFVNFRVSQRPDLPPGTEIRNTAAIYFDNNPPVITNQTLHTIGHDFIVLGSQQVFNPQVQVVVTPNPMRGRVQVSAKGIGASSDIRFRLIDQLGRLSLEQNPGVPNFEFDAGRLPEGIYFYEFWENGRLAVTGKLLKTGP